MTLSLYEMCGLGCGIRRKTPGTVPKTGTSGLAVASDPIGFWEGVGPDCDYAVATPQSSTMSYARKKKKSKSHGYHIQIARVRRTSSCRSICLHPGQNGRCSKIIENSQIGKSRYLEPSTTTQMAQITVQYGRPSRSS